jgi:hypothetical protein
LGLLLYALGIILGAGFTAAIVWANYEASLFDMGLPADARVTSLRCPALITSGEEGMVTASFSNPSDRPVRRVIRANISDGFISFPRQIETRTLLEPGETRHLQWTVTPDDAAWDRLILVRIYVLRNTPLPSMTGTCGTVFVDLTGVRGWQLSFILLVATILSIGGGFWLWYTRTRLPQGESVELTQPFTALGGMVLIGLLAALTGWWLVSAILLVLTVLLLIVLFAWRFTPR